MPENGPDLTGTRALTDVEAGQSEIALGGGGCEPWDCGVNGPDMTGTAIGSDILILSVDGFDDMDGWVCTELPPNCNPGNGPDLTGTRIERN